MLRPEDRCAPEGEKRSLRLQRLRWWRPYLAAVLSRTVPEVPLSVTRASCGVVWRAS